MAQFLRDSHISNVKITEDVISQLTEAFVNRAKPLIDKAEKTGDNERKPFLTYIIRFDEKGYRLFTLEEILQYFRRAKAIERIIITVETPASLKTNRLVGEHLEIKFDRLDEKNCYLSVTSDDQDWVEASYSAVQDILNRNKTRNGWARSAWAGLTIQLLGVAAGFGLSLWAASRISPNLAIENAFIITFLFAFLIFSNAWGYLNNVILYFVHSTFPNIQFYRPEKDRISWLLQALIGGIATAIALYALNILFTYIGTFLSEIPK